MICLYMNGFSKAAAKRRIVKHKSVRTPPPPTPHYLTCDTTVSRGLDRIRLDQCRAPSHDERAEGDRRGVNCPLCMSRLPR